jgi:hypothetical protein
MLLSTVIYHFQKSSYTPATAANYKYQKSLHINTMVSSIATVYLTSINLVESNAAGAVDVPTSELLHKSWSAGLCLGSRLDLKKLFVYEKIMGFFLNLKMCFLKIRKNVAISGTRCSFSCLESLCFLQYAIAPGRHEKSYSFFLTFSNCKIRPDEDGKKFIE